MVGKRNHGTTDGVGGVYERNQGTSDKGVIKKI